MCYRAVLPTLVFVHAIRWIMRRWSKANDLDWPWWMAIGIAFFAIAATVVVVGQRDALVPPGWQALVGFVIISPWILEHAVGWKLPRLLFGAIVIAGVAMLLTSPTDNDLAPFILVVLVAEVAGTGSVWSSIPVALAAVATLVGFDVYGDFKGSLYWWLGIAIIWDGGFAMQWQQRLLVRTREAQASRVAKAATDERQRIAREIHDVIAHSLSVTMLHLTAARHSLTTDKDVNEAVDALEDAERIGRQAMSDIRRTVGLLESPDGDTSPLPAIDDIEKLVDDVRSTGAVVQYTLRGDPDSVTPAAGLDLYRIMQESLANTVKHASGSEVDARLDLIADPVRLSVRNTVPSGTNAVLLGPDSNGGWGLRGMRQRVELLGGGFDAGPDDDGWHVSVTLPRPADESARPKERDGVAHRCPTRTARR
jgi:signal transduction histidine kinase